MSDARLRVAAIAALHLTFVVMAGIVWEPSHDEGVTWFQAFGAVPLKASPAPPVPIESVYRVIDGRTPRGIGDVVDGLMADGGMHPPLYYLGLAKWASWVGTSRLLLNLPLYLVGLLSLFLFKDLGDRLVPGDHAGEWAMLLFAVSPWFVSYANLARPYAWVVCLTVASTSLLLRAPSGPPRARAACLSGFALISVVGLLSLYHYVFVVGWQLALLLGRAWTSPERGRRAFEVAAIAIAVAHGFAIWLPNFLSHLEATGNVESYFHGFPPFGEWPALFGRLLLLFGLGGSVVSHVTPVVAPAFVVLGLGTFVSLLRSFASEPTSGNPRLVWATLPLIPLGIGAADWMRGTHTLFITKTSFALFPFAILLIVRAFSGLPEGWRRLGLACWAGIFVVAVAGDLHATGTRRTPMELAASELASRDDPSHLVVLSSAFPGYAPPFLLELRTAGVERVRVALAPGSRLDELLHLATADASIERLTLVNFDVPYAKRQTWQPARLARVEARAIAAGWQVPGRRTGGPRELRILSPMPVEYFAF